MSAPTYQAIPQVVKTYGVDLGFSLISVMSGVSDSSGAYTFSTQGPEGSAITILGGVATINAYTPSAITITATQAAAGGFTAGSTTFTLMVNRGAPTYQAIPPVAKIFGTDVSFSLTSVMSGKSNSSGAYTFTKTGDAISSIDGAVAFINNTTYSPSAIITATQAASGNYTAGSTSFNLQLSRVVTWTPQLEQTIKVEPYSPVYFNTANEGPGTTQVNVYSLTYSTTFKLISGTFTIPGVPAGAVPRDTDVPTELLSLRGTTLLGVIPLISLSSDNTRAPITFSFPTNSYAISVVSFDRDYYVIPQPSGDSANAVGLYKISGAANVRLPYKNALVINGVYDVSGGYRYDQPSTTLRMEIKQAAYEPSGIGADTIRYLEKKIVVPLTLTKAATNIGIKPFSGAGAYTIPGSDSAGVITREYLDGFIDLSFSQFATTTRKNLSDGSPDYGDVIYYLTFTPPRTFYFGGNERNVRITNNRIVFNKVTVSPDGTHTLILIKFLQEETPVYLRSTQRIGETPGFVEQPDPPVSPPVTDITRTIRIKINKSTPTFVGQIPATNNTANPLQVYRLPDLNKMTSEGSFVLTPPLSNNTDSSSNFLFSSNNESLLKIRVSGGTGTGIGTTEGAVYTAYIYGSGTATITVYQPATTNFNQKVAYFDVNIFEITPAIINCNTNLFYTNPYNREFWTRFKPECRSSDLVDSLTGFPLTATQVDEVYDMRRKAEILKYDKNVGGLTKNQKYAKASRGELMRKIGNENKYLSGVGGAFTLTCPTTPANRAVLCGLTTACGVPGKERLLCYDPSVNLYNYKRTYTYEAGLQATLAIPTTILTEPTNLRISNYDNELNKITFVWDAPSSNGGFPITGYVITYSVDNKTWAPYKSVFPYNPATAAQAAGVIASAAAIAAGESAAAAASAASTAAAAVIAAGATYNPVSREINGTSVVFERIPGSVEIRANTVYYISVFSGNVRGLSSVPATITVKTSSVPSIINDFGFTNAADERQNLMVDLKWTDPLNTGVGAGGGFNGPPIRQYNLYYRKVPDTVWLKQTIDISSIIISSNGGGGQSRRYILRNLSNENKYELKIEPINSVGVGGESAIITARTLMKPAAPTGLALTAKYGLLPPIITDVSGNYINIIWSKPNTGGSPITLYNITITPPVTLGSSISTLIIVPYNITTTDMRTSYSADIGRIGTNPVTEGIYSVTIAAFNGYIYSNESISSSVTVKPRSAKPTIFAMEGTYTSTGLSYVEMTFYIVTEIVGSITLVRVNGLNSSYLTNTNIYNKLFSLDDKITGEHKIRIPVRYTGQDVIVVGTAYSVSITLVFSSGLEQTSELFSYTPEIRYLTT
jgi:hypothetical protein